MAFVSPTLSSTSLLRGGSGVSDANSVLSEMRRVASKKKRLQSAYYDAKQGKWRCRNCGYTYLIPYPDHHVRREHKKLCEGSLKVQQWLGAVRFRPDEGTETLRDAAKDTPPLKPDTTAEQPVARFAKDVKVEGAEKLAVGHGVNERSKTDEFVDGSGGLDPVTQLDLKTTADPDASLVEANDASEALQNLKVEERELDSEKVPEAKPQPRVDDDHPRAHSSQEMGDSDTKPSHGAREDTTDHIDSSGVKSSEFVAASEVSEVSGLQSVDNVNKLEEEKQAGSGSLDVKGVDAKERQPLRIREEVDNPKSGEHAANVVERTEERGPSLTDDDIAFTEIPAIEEDVGHRDLSLTADDKAQMERAEVARNRESRGRAVADDDGPWKDEAQVVEEGESGIPADDYALENMIEKGGEHRVMATDDDALGAGLDEREPSLGAADEDSSKADEKLVEIDEGEPRPTSRDETEKPEKAAEVRRSEPTRTDDGEDEGHHRKDTEPSPVARDGTDDEVSVVARDGTDNDESKQEHQNLQIVEGGKGNDFSVTAKAEDALKDAERVEESDGGEPASRAANQKENEPRAVATDGTEDTSGEDEDQSFPAVEGGTGDEASLKITSPALADLLGLDTEDGDVPVVSQEVMSPALADLLGLDTGQWADPGKQEIKSIDAALLEPKDIVAVGQTSSGKIKISSAQRNWDDWQHVVSSEDILTKVSSPLLSEEAGDAKPPVSENKQTSHGQSDNGKNLVQKEPEGPAQDKCELVDKVAPEDSGNEDLVPSAILSSHQNTDGTSSEVLVRLTAAGTNWDDWEDVIRSGSLLIQEIKPLSSKKGEDGESSSGDHAVSQGVLVLPKGDSGDGSGSVQKKIDAVLESKGAFEGKLEHETETGPSSLTLHIPEGDNTTGVLASRALSVDSDLSTAKEAESTVTSDLEVLKGPETSLSKTPGLKESSNENVQHNTPFTSQPATGQTSRFLSHLSSAVRNWEDWEDVVRESGGVSGLNNLQPVMEPDVAEQERPDGGVVESANTLGGEWVVLSSPRGANASRTVNDPWEVVEGPKHEMQPEEGGAVVPLLTSLESNVLDKGLSPSAQTTVNLSIGQQIWAGLDDLTRSEYILLNGPDGELQVSRKTNEGDPEALQLSFNTMEGRKTMSLEEPDDGGSPSLRRAGRMTPRFDGNDSEKPLTLRSLQGASRIPSIKSDYSPGSLSSRDIKGASKSFPGFSPIISEFEDSIIKRPSLVSTRTHSGYPASRQVGSNDLQKREMASKAYHDHQHYHHHGHEDKSATGLVSQYDVVSLLHDQTKYDLKCPICGSLITKKIVLRKKKRRFVRERDLSSIVTCRP